MMAACASATGYCAGEATRRSLRIQQLRASKGLQDQSGDWDFEDHDDASTECSTPTHVKAESGDEPTGASFLPPPEKEPKIDGQGLVEIYGWGAGQMRQEACAAPCQCAQGNIRTFPSWSMQGLLGTALAGLKVHLLTALWEVHLC